MWMIFRENRSRLGRQKATTLRVRCQEATVEASSGQPNQRVNNTSFCVVNSVNDLVRSGQAGLVRGGAGLDDILCEG